MWVKKFTVIHEGDSPRNLNISVGVGSIIADLQSQFERNGDMSMANTQPLWDEPVSIPPTPPPPPSPQAIRRAKQRERYANGPPTDIIEWLRHNRPGHFGELMDLRKALYSRRTHGKYRIDPRGHTMAGEEKFFLTGPASAVLIVSNKSRHFLLRTLCRMRKARRWPPIRY